MNYANAAMNLTRGLRAYACSTYASPGRKSPAAKSAKNGLPALDPRPLIKLTRYLVSSSQAD